MNYLGDPAPYSQFLFEKQNSNGTQPLDLKLKAVLLQWKLMTPVSNNLSPRTGLKNSAFLPVLVKWPIYSCLPLVAKVQSTEQDFASEFSAKLRLMPGKTHPSLRPALRQSLLTVQQAKTWISVYRLMFELHHCWPCDVSTSPYFLRLPRYLQLWDRFGLVWY